MHIPTLIDSHARRLATTGRLEATASCSTISCGDLRRILEEASLIAISERYDVKVFSIVGFDVETGDLEGLHIPQRIAIKYCRFNTLDDEISSAQNANVLLISNCYFGALEFEQCTFSSVSIEISRVSIRESLSVVGNSLKRRRINNNLFSEDLGFRGEDRPNINGSLNLYDVYIGGDIWILEVTLEDAVSKFSICLEMVRCLGIVHFESVRSKSIEIDRSSFSGVFQILDGQFEEGIACVGSIFRSSTQISIRSIGAARASISIGLPPSHCIGKSIVLDRCAFLANVDICASAPDPNNDKLTLEGAIAIRRSTINGNFYLQDIGNIKEIGQDYTIVQEDKTDFVDKVILEDLIIDGILCFKKTYFRGSVIAKRVSVGQHIRFDTFAAEKINLISISCKNSIVFIFFREQISKKHFDVTMKYILSDSISLLDLDNTSKDGKSLDSNAETTITDAIIHMDDCTIQNELLFTDDKNLTCDSNGESSSPHFKARTVTIKGSSIGSIVLSMDYINEIDLSDLTLKTLGLHPIQKDNIDSDMLKIKNVRFSYIHTTNYDNAEIEKETIEKWITVAKTTYRHSFIEQILGALERSGDRETCKSLDISTRPLRQDRGTVSFFSTKIVGHVSRYGYDMNRSVYSFAVVWMVFSLFWAVVAAGCGSTGCGPSDEPMIWRSPQDYPSLTSQSNGATSPAEADRRPGIPPFDPPLYALDLMLPVVDLHMDSHWMPNYVFGERSEDHGNRFLTAHGLFFATVRFLNILAGTSILAIIIFSFTSSLARGSRRE